MQPTLLAFAMLALAAWVPTAISADEPPDETAGATAAVDPKAVIAARQALMAELQRLMAPIDALVAGQDGNRAAQKSAANTIAQMLMGVPRLFPPTTNPYDPSATTPVTVALPSVWQDLAEFSALNASASAAAATFATLDDDAELSAAALSLREACDACHASFMRPYEPESVRTEDLEFDFDALFKNDEAAPGEAPNPE